MNPRELILLSPYRVPAQNTLSLGNDEAAAFLSAYSALWHPALLAGAAAAPKIASAYDHENPLAGSVYATPDSPPLLLPDDWEQRTANVGSIVFRATVDRTTTLANVKTSVERNPQPAEALAFDSTLLNLEPEKLKPFFAIGFGFLMVNTLFEAMEHENLLSAPDLWQDVQQAIEATKTGDGDGCRRHLEAAAQRLLQAREILYPSPIHIIDLCLLTEANVGQPLPAAFDKKLAVNLVAPAVVLEKLGREHPERLAALRERLQAEQIEICSGSYVEREDALLPVESQVWNLLKAQNAFRALTGSELRVYGRQRFGAHPQLPMMLFHIGVNKAILLAFDNGVLPNHRAVVTSWPSPDGKQVEAFTRLPYAADNPQTFFHLAHYLHKTIRQDQAAALALLHKGAPASPWYDDWVELTTLDPALGQWNPLHRFFIEAMAGEYASASTADEFHSDYLEERTTAKAEAPVGWFAKQVRGRRALDTVLTLAGIYRGLVGAGDQLKLDATLAKLEDDCEIGAADAEKQLAQVQQQLLEAMSGRLLSRATADRPGYLVLNPCSFVRRVALELEGIRAPLPIEGPMKACQVDGDKARLVLEVPQLGFAWFPQNAPANYQPPPPRMTLADKRGVRNEFFEAEVDPKTGGLAALRDHRLRTNRLGQILVFNPGSRMRCRDVSVTCNGAALGEVTSSGDVVGEQEQVLAHFKQRFRAWLGRPMLEMRIEITPTQPPAGYPWHAYFAARFAWGDERVTLLRGVNGMGYVTTQNRPESPDYIEMRLGAQRTTLFPGGLPFHQRQGTRFVDVILLPEGENTHVFDLGLGLDREYPMHTALGVVTPVPVIATAKGPPHVGAAGWLFHLDAPNLLLTTMRPAADGSDGVLLRMLETGNSGGHAEFRCVRNPKQAVLVDARGNMLMEAGINGDAINFESSPCDLTHLKVNFS